MGKGKGEADGPLEPWQAYSVRALLQSLPEVPVGGGPRRGRPPAPTPCDR